MSVAAWCCSKIGGVSFSESWVCDSTKFSISLEASISSIVRTILLIPSRYTGAVLDRFLQWSMCYDRAYNTYMSLEMQTLLEKT